MHGTRYREGWEDNDSWEGAEDEDRAHWDGRQREDDPLRPYAWWLWPLGGHRSGHEGGERPTNWEAEHSR